MTDLHDLPRISETDLAHGEAIAKAKAEYEVAELLGNDTAQGVSDMRHAMRNGPVPGDSETTELLANLGDKLRLLQIGAMQAANRADKLKAEAVSVKEEIKRILGESL